MKIYFKERFLLVGHVRDSLIIVTNLRLVLKWGFVVDNLLTIYCFHVNFLYAFFQRRCQLILVLYGKDKHKT